MLISEHKHIKRKEVFMSNNKLELTWFNKDAQIKVEPRLLIENPKLSNISHNKNGELNYNSDNLLIHGDNLIALKSLESKYTSKIKCIYIDPPYNTGSAFKDFNDNLQHSTWLSLMKPRLESLRKLLQNSGVIFISIDDDERDYLKILCDEVFGRDNFIGCFIWEKKKKPSFLSNIGVITEYILIYAKDKSHLPPLIFGSTTKGKKYPINNAGNGTKNITFRPKSVRFGLVDQIVKAQDMSAGNIITRLLNDVIIEDGYNKNEFTLFGEWRYSQMKIDEIIDSGDEIRISQIPFRPNHIKAGDEPKKMKNLLSVSHYKMATNEDATKESRLLFGVTDAFSYPKPELLIKTLIESITIENDIVLDSFLGSGTTAAVAHKLGRRWIGIELGSHAYTHCKTRLDKVIGGEQGGISEMVNWKGCGGYRFYELAPTLIKFDSFGQSIINPEYNADMLAAAVALHEGYDYNPDRDIFWKQAKNGDFSYLFTTTRHLDRNFVDYVASQMTEGESLVISCKSFDSLVSNLHRNITIKKIPQSLLKNCGFDKENYNLNIINPPVYGDDEDE